MPYLGVLLLLLVCLVQYDCFSLIIFCFVRFCNLLEAYSFLRRYIEGMDTNERIGGEELRGAEKVETVIRI